ncbi:hypothetical protein [Streptomyces sp. C3-3]|uniref:hypothetical protein n=1 Tax=Streptomyces sp. C3-3 TaxID=2824901 RepID=UPI001B36E30D|nr:hypothetical protein [Streptomyces sp. C3-3]MBQ1118542.1 hypothetical protein [Streptomyces sp. C3-3]
MTTQTETTTPQDIGTHALARAVEYADKAASYSGGTFSGVQENAPVVAVYSSLAAVYADVAKAAAALAVGTA